MGLMPIVGRTRSEAQVKHDALRAALELGMPEIKRLVLPRALVGKAKRFRFGPGFEIGATWKEAAGQRRKAKRR
jgi:hypothetical protein